MMHKIAIFMAFLLLHVFPIAAQSNLEDGIWDVKWNPSGTLLAVANPGGQVNVYDTSGQLVRSFTGHAQRATSVAWSPTGEIIASGGYDAYIRFWNVETGQLIHEMNILVEPVGDIEWQPNGSYLAIAGFDTVQIWDTGTYEPVTDGVPGNVLDLEWSPDGSHFAFGSTNAVGIARIDGNRFDVSSFSISGQLAQLRTSSVSWSSDGSQIVGTSEGQGVLIWDVSTTELVSALFQNGEVFYDAQFIGAGKAGVIALTADGNIYTLDSITGEVLQSTQMDAFLWSLAWNPTFDLLAISGTSRTADNLISDNTESLVDNGFLSLVRLSTDGTVEE